MLVDHATSCTFKVNGSDALEWLQGMVTHDVIGATSAVQRGLCLDRLGKIQAEVLTWKQPGDGSLRLSVCGGDPEKLHEHFCRFIIMEDVSIESTQERLYSISGPIEETIPARLAAHGRVAALQWVTTADIVCLVESERETNFRDATEQLGLVNSSVDDWDAWRIAAGLPAYGIDYDGADTPAVAGLVEELVSSSKGCYLGQEVVCRTQMRGAIREQVVRMQLEAIPKVGATVVLASSGEPIGRLTSVTALDKSNANPAPKWGIGRVKRSSIDERADVMVDSIAGRICPRTQ
ncbi:MAG TPA: hypothetical protein VIV60_03125 [Polyangiaceae bacterium]